MTEGGTRVPAGSGASAPRDFVRPFVLTGGRTSAPVEVRIESVLAVVAGGRRVRLDLQHQRLVDACRPPRSVAELASALDLALGVVQVLAGDLVHDGVLETTDLAGIEVDVSLLERILEGVRAL